MAAEQEGRLSETEMIDILEELARHGRSETARIAAIKVLRGMAAGEEPAEAGFAALDELAPRRRRDV